MTSRLDIEYKKDLFVDLFLPEGEEFDVFVYFHGGGLEAGSRKKVDVFAKTLAEHSIATASVEYRMYPSARFPDFIVDAAESVAFVKNNLSEYGRVRNIYVGGSSAGGYISMMLCFDSRYLGAVGMKPTDVAAYIHDAGQPTAHFNVLRERGIDTRRVIVDETAPLYFIGMEAEYSPMLFIVSDNDMPCRYEQTLLTVKTLEHFGHKDKVTLDIKCANHCSYVYKADEDGDGMLGKTIVKYLENIGLI